MRSIDRLILSLLVASSALIACAGAGPPPQPDSDSAAAARASQELQDLLARLDILIASGDGDGTVPAAVLAEARSLRIEALSALASGDDALARDLLASAIALFGDGQG